MDGPRQFRIIYPLHPKMRNLTAILEPDNSLPMAWITARSHHLMGFPPPFLHLSFSR